MYTFIEFLIIFSLFLLSIEIILSTGGILAFSGIVTFFLAFALMFLWEITIPRLFLTITVPAFIVLSILSITIIILAYKAHKKKPLIGEKNLVGKKGKCLKKIEKNEPGLVEVEGEIWTAFSNEIINEGDFVTIIDQESTKLKVKKEV